MNYSKNDQKGGLIATWINTTDSLSVCLIYCMCHIFFTLKSGELPPNAVSVFESRTVTSSQVITSHHSHTPTSEQQLTYKHIDWIQNCLNAVLWLKKLSTNPALKQTVHLTTVLYLNLFCEVESQPSFDLSLSHTLPDSVLCEQKLIPIDYAVNLKFNNISFPGCTGSFE